MIQGMTNGKENKANPVVDGLTLGDLALAFKLFEQRLTIVFACDVNFTTNSYFSQDSSLTFEFSVKDQCDEALDGSWDDDSSQCYEPFRTISVISADKVPAVMAKLGVWITSKN